MKDLLIKDREVDLFREIYCRKVVDFKFIWAYYPELSKSGCQKKIYRLKVNGFIEAVKSPLDGKSNVFFVSKKTFNEYLFLGNERRIQIKSNSILHDLDLISIENRFKESEKVQSFIPENALQTGENWYLDDNLDFFIKKRSDAFISLKGLSNHLRAGLEYERHLKSESRLINTLKMYYESNEVDLVFYIFKKQFELEKLKNIELENFSDTSPKVFYQNLDQLMSDEVPYFFNRENKKNYLF